MPAGPPPTTNAAWTIGCVYGSSGRSRAAFSTAMRTMSRALEVAERRSALCTQESWLRMFDISRRYGLSPARRQTRLNVPSWVFGEQAPTTSRLRWLSRIFFAISVCVFPAQAKRTSSAWATPGTVFA